MLNLGPAQCRQHTTGCKPLTMDPRPVGARMLNLGPAQCRQHTTGCKPLTMDPRPGRGEHAESWICF